MSDWKNAGYSPRESGYYPPGAEFDPRAPWNQEEPEFDCDVCDGTGELEEEDYKECPNCHGTGKVSD